MQKSQPRPNAPNTLAWTRPLGTPAPKGKAKFNPWTAPLATVIAR